MYLISSSIENLTWSCNGIVMRKLYNEGVGAGLWELAVVRRVIQGWGY
jgi:hypothetical protein